MCGVFKTILVGRSEWEWLQELGKSRAGACQEARHQKYSLYKAEAQIGPGEEGGILTCKSHLENDKRHSAGGKWTRHRDIYNHINFTKILILTDFHSSIQAPVINHYCSASPDNRLSVTAVTCQWSLQPSREGFEWDYWNTKASGHHAGLHTLQGPFQTQCSNMNINWETAQVWWCPYFGSHSCLDVNVCCLELLKWSPERQTGYSS